MRCARSVSSIGVLSLVAAVVLADDTVPLTAGARLRIARATGGRLVGTVLALDDKSVTLQAAGHDDPMPATIPREAITKLEVSRGRQSRSRGAVIGLGVGAGAGAILGVALGGGDCSKTFGPCGSSGAAEGAAILGGLFGAVGAGIGALIPPGERWEEIPVDRIRLGFQPVRGRGAGVTLTFVF